MVTILLIEDDAWLADLYRDVLQSDGHQVVHARDARTAMDRIDEHQIDVVVLDLFLPAHNGVALLHELRSYPDLAVTPVIIHSALNPEQAGLTPEQWAAYGVVEYVYKVTSRPQELLRAVNRVLQKDPHEAI